jgi:hypothetical protein
MQALIILTTAAVSWILVYQAVLAVSGYLLGLVAR